MLKLFRTGGSHMCVLTQPTSWHHYPPPSRTSSGTLLQLENARNFDSGQPDHSAAGNALAAGNAANDHPGGAAGLGGSKDTETLADRQVGATAAGGAVVPTAESGALEGDGVIETLAREAAGAALATRLGSGDGLDACAPLETVVVESAAPRPAPGTPGGAAAAAAGHAKSKSHSASRKVRLLPRPSRRLKAVAFSGSLSR
jgi:hypothetical protein